MNIGSYALSHVCKRHRTRVIGSFTDASFHAALIRTVKLSGLPWMYKWDRSLTDNSHFKFKCWDEFESDVQYPLKNLNCNATNDDLWNTVDVQIYKHAILKGSSRENSRNSAARTKNKQGNVQERTILVPPLTLVVFIFICLFMMFSWGLAWCQNVCPLWEVAITD